LGENEFALVNALSKLLCFAFGVTITYSFQFGVRLLTLIHVCRTHVCLRSKVRLLAMAKVSEFPTMHKCNRRDNIKLPLYQKTVWQKKSVITYGTCIRLHTWNQQCSVLLELNDEQKGDNQINSHMKYSHARSEVKDAIGILQPFLGSLGVGAGRPESHGAMQKSTRAFRLVAHNVNSEARERNLTG
jgi:hypothetical protein